MQRILKANIARGTWRVAEELHRYLVRISHVSGEVRLTRAEELLLLRLESSEGDSTKDPPLLLINRLNFLERLQALVENPRGRNGNDLLTAPFQSYVLAPKPPSVYDFDAILDKSCLGLDDNIVKKMAIINYSRPKDEDLMGVSAIKKLNKWLDVGLRLRGGGNRWDLPFFFFACWLFAFLPF